MVILSLGIPPWITTKSGLQNIHSNQQLAVPIRRVNVSNLEGKPFTPAIFWLGKVDLSNNYTDVRVYYCNDYLKMAFHIMDRRLWEDNSGNVSDIANWDAVSVYLDLDGNVGNAPNLNSYRLDLELNNLHGTYRGNNSDWITASVPITYSTTWRGDSGPNSNQDAKGWEAFITVPFKSLGLSGPPANGNTWGLVVVVHDRDDASGSTILNTIWPETMNSTIPATWGQLHFGFDDYARSPAITTSILTVQNGLNGSMVEDADVGGHTTCGGDPASYWTQWGNSNYAGYTQVNIQNQWDISDWPCFSKYYITFSLDSLPKGITINSASLIMYLNGNAGGGQWEEPPDSYIQAFTVGEDWNETTINWNNAPLAIENLSGTWVYPKTTTEWIAYSWDVSHAVEESYASGAPLRLALYSADGERHSGKYFLSSDWQPDIWPRPSLRISLGIPCNSPGINCKFNYLPLTIR
jgi:hypothetical protein